MSNNVKDILIFPPLVSTSLNSYYPASAMLAGACVEANFDAPMQLDFNRELVTELFNKETLNYFIANLNRQIALHVGQTLNNDIISDIQTLGVLNMLRDNITSNSNSDFSFDIPGGQRLSFYECRHVLYNLFSLDLDLSKVLATKNISDFEQNIKKAGWRGKFLCEFYHRKATNIARFKPRFVGITAAMGPQLIHALLLAYAISQQCETFICIGGPSISLLSKDLRAKLLDRLSYIDAFAIGEGEKTLVELLTALTNQKSPAGISGLECSSKWIKDSKADITTTEKEEESKSRRLKIPKPLYDAKLLNELGPGRFLSVLESRSCYWGKCTFCDYIHIYRDGSFKPRSHLEIIDELVALEIESGVRSFYLVTDSLAPAQARRISEEIIRREMQGHFELRSYIMIDPGFTKEILRKMKIAGFKNVTIGIETFSERLLSFVEKRGTKAQAIELLQHAADQQLQVTVNMIANLPTATKEDALHDMKIVEQIALKHGKYIHFKAAYQFSLTASSTIGQNPEKYGLDLKMGDNKSHKSFASNELAYEDVNGMQGDELTTVLQEYSNLVRRLKADNGTLVNKNRQLKCKNGLWSTYWRGPSEQFDKLVVCDVKSDRFLLFTPQVAPIVRKLLRGYSFSYENENGKINGRRSNSMKVVDLFFKMGWLSSVRQQVMQ